MICIGEKYVQEEFLGEESLGEEYILEMPCKKSFSVKSILQEEFPG